jgi:DNA polymerase I-like protein with 3'-5' exonuclease and polymerase domains
LYYKSNPAGTDTGRLSSTESSFWTGLQIQNIPQGPAIKSWITADEGWLLGESDYAQSEARCVGYLSGCTALINLVESDKDFHKWNASAFFGVPYDEITKDLRNLAKRVNHGAGYGMGAQVMLETMGPKMVANARLLLKLPAKWTLVQVCQHLLKMYENTYPEVKRGWCDAIKREISLTKKLKSPLGWTRYFFEDPVKSKHAMNAAIAHAPQNLSVSIINKVFYQIWWDTVYGDLRGIVRIKAQIHDSILYAYKNEDSPTKVAERMRYAVQVKDINKVSRTLLIPSDTNAGEFAWGSLK